MVSVPLGFSSLPTHTILIKARPILVTPSRYLRAVYLLLQRTIDNNRKVRGFWLKRLSFHVPAHACHIVRPTSATYVEKQVDLVTGTYCFSDTWVWALACDRNRRLLHEVFQGLAFLQLALNSRVLYSAEVGIHLLASTSLKRTNLITHRAASYIRENVSKSNLVNTAQVLLSLSSEWQGSSLCLQQLAQK